MIEYYCNNGVYSSTKIGCPTGYSCMEGICAQITCTDSDGGKNYYTLGTVSRAGQTYTDACIGTLSLREYYCSGTNVANETKVCSCSKGKCAQPACTDTEGTQDIYSTGTVSTADGSHTESCVGTNTVEEWWCSNGQPVHQNMNCPLFYKCSKGKCVHL
ncbi:MAG: hypothetical protein V1822_00125 [Candidatus Micrarchaeota archaeon]